MRHIDYGTIKFDGITITFTQWAYADNYGTDGDIRYYAHGVDANGNKYKVAWDLTPERIEQERIHREESHDAINCDCNDDESIACDWDNPVSVEEVG
jgi:hypothetical protein